jgi:hypothetical protein
MDDRVSAPFDDLEGSMGNESRKLRTSPFPLPSLFI